MVGMLQILTYLLAFYLVVKGFEVLQIALASPRQNRSGIILLGVLVVLVLKHFLTPAYRFQQFSPSRWLAAGADHIYIAGLRIR